MKKLLKTTIAIALVIIISFSFSTTVFAYEYGSFDIKSMVKTEERGTIEISCISSEDISRIKNSKALKFKNKSDEEKLEEIFNALNFNLNEQQSDKVNEVISLSQIENIRIETTYIEADENGTQKKISKKQALEAAEAKNNYLASLSPTEYYEIMTTSDTGPTASHGNPEPIIDSKKTYVSTNCCYLYPKLSWYGNNNRKICCYDSLQLVDSSFCSPHGLY